MHLFHFLVLLLLASPNTAQEKSYDLSLDAPPRMGQKSRLAETNHMKMALRVNGQEASASEEKKVFEATEVVVKADGKGGAELLRTYSKAQHVVEGKMEPYGFEGKDVRVIVAKDEAPKFSYADGGELSAFDLAAIKGTFGAGGGSDESNPLEPKARVRVGETWSPDVKAVAEMFDPEMANSVDVSKSKAHFTLRSVERRNGADFGKIDGVIELAFQSMGPLPLEKAIPMTMTVDLDACIDNSSQDGVMKMTIQMKGESSASAGSEKVALDMDMAAENEMVRTSLSTATTSKR
jgi:hypothetical protein